MALFRNPEAERPMEAPAAPAKTTLSYEEFLALDEITATTVASETAATILRVTQARHRELMAAAEAVVSEAERQATGQLRDARDTSQRLRDEAVAEAERARSEARTEAERLRSEAEREAAELRARAAKESEDLGNESAEKAESLLADARARAEGLERRATEQAEQALMAASAAVERLRGEADEYASVTRQSAEQDAQRTREQAKKEREDILAEARQRRDALMESVEEQRRWVQSIVGDANDLHMRVISALSEARGNIDQALTRINQAPNGSERIVADADAQIVRIAELED
jgi:vacuolar-type H+-ATPase subunit H